MIGRASLTLGAVAAVLAAWPLLAQEQGTAAGPRTVIVEMSNFGFKPAKVTVRHGDTVRFVQTTDTPHNVKFEKVPPGTRLGTEEPLPISETGTRVTFPPLREGPFLYDKGEAYDLLIDENFAAGEHDFVCTPHESVGMKGKIIVTD